MKYSVIIPAYNCSKSIKETIESIWNSGIDNSEIIIIDDGSIDLTACMSMLMIKQDCSLKYVGIKNSGVSSARNIGIQVAEGEYILFADADDFYAKGSLTLLKHGLNQKPDLLIFGMSFDYYNRGKLYRRETMTFPEEGLKNNENISDVVLRLFTCNYLSSVCNKVIRRQILLDNRIYFNQNLFVMEDFLFTLDIIKKCSSIYLSSDIVYHYRHNYDPHRSGNRLQAVESLSEYFIPFGRSFHELKLLYPNNRIVGELEDTVYLMLLKQKIQFSSLRGIRQTAHDFMNSEYSDSPVCLRDKTVKMLMHKEYTKLYIISLKNRVKHAVAEYYKANKSTFRERGM